MSLRVVQWGAGAVGVEALRFVLDAPDLELVGVRCHTDAKDGMDAGIMVGRPAVGVLATRGLDELSGLQADCVLYMPRDAFLDPTVPDSPAAAWVEEVAGLLERGCNVVSPLQSAMHWRHLASGAALRDRLDGAARAGGASVFFTGLDPGFVSDCLVIALSSAAGAIRQVRTLEVIDYSTYAAPDVLASMGFGAPPDGADDSARDSLVPSWGCALWLVADALGVDLDLIDLTTETFLAPQDLVSAGGLTVAAGTVGALQWSITGVVGGEPLITARHVARIGADMAPAWPTIGERGGYRVEVDGNPPLRLELPLGLDGGTGTCLGDAVVMTAARCVNAVAGVVAAAPGYVLQTQLPAYGGRHGVALRAR